MFGLFISEQICVSMLAGILISLILGIVGTMVVHNKMAFFSDSLGHCSLTGIAIGNLLGIKNPYISVVLFSILFSLLISYLIEKEKSSIDTIISIFSSAGLSLGLCILTLSKEMSGYQNFFVGDILSVNQNEIFGLIILLFIVCLFWVFMFNKFVISSLSKDLAVSKLINFKLYRSVFMVLISIVISFAVKWVGILLINSLLTLPAAAARNMSKSMKQYLFFSVIFAVISGIFGFLLSYLLGSSSAPIIVLVSTVLYIASYLIKIKI